MGSTQDPPAECVPPFDTDDSQVTDCVRLHRRIMDRGPASFHCFIHNYSIVHQATTGTTTKKSSKLNKFNLKELKEDAV